MANSNYASIYTGLLPPLYDFTAKDQSMRDYVIYMLARTQSMFEWSGLPDTIPKRTIELYLQYNGYVGIVPDGNQIYAMYGGLGGQPDYNYMPTMFVAANPALKFSKSLKISDECVVIPGDSMYMGLLPMFRRYATALMENDLTMRITDINSRIMSLMSASDDRTKKSADKFLTDVENGKLGCIGEGEFFDGVKSQPYAGNGNASRFTDLIEYQQYLKAGWFNDLGLQANYNMKRETIGSEEAAMNEEILLPLIDDMLMQRQIGCEKVNAMFGTNWSVDLNSSWKHDPAPDDPASDDPPPDDPKPDEGGDPNED